MPRGRPVDTAHYELRTSVNFYCYIEALRRAWKNSTGRRLSVAKASEMFEKSGGWYSIVAVNKGALETNRGVALGFSQASNSYNKRLARHVHGGWLPAVTLASVHSRAKGMIREHGLQRFCVNMVRELLGQPSLHCGWVVGWRAPHRLDT